MCTEYDPCSYNDTPHTHRFNFCSRGFPIEADARQKIFPGRGLFGHGLIAARPIIPHSRGLNQRSWHSFGITDCGHKRIACSDSALSYPLFTFRGPTSVGDSFAGEIDNRIHLGHKMAPSFGSFTVPLFQSYAIGRRGLMPFRGPRQNCHFTVAIAKTLCQGRSDQPRASSYQYTHSILPLSESPLINGGRPSFADLRPPTMPRHSVPFPEDE